MPKKASSKAQIGGITLNSTSFDRLLKEIIGRIEKNKKTFIVTPNPEFIVYAQKNPWFKKILNQADFAIPDGVGLLMAAKYLNETQRVKLPLLVSIPVFLWLGLKVGLAGVFKRDYLDVLPEQVSGSDLLVNLCRVASKKNYAVYFLGSKPGIAKKALKVLKNQYPRLKGWASSGPKIKAENTSDGGRLEQSGSHDSSEVEEWIRKINKKKPTFLFAAFGMGKQEKFIYDNWDRLDVKLAMGVGGSFDYLAGFPPRAPKFFRKKGLEWAYRLWKEPSRFKRILIAFPLFPLKIFLHSLASKKQ